MCLAAAAGFGGALTNDYMIEAAIQSPKEAGVPVKLLWSREDDYGARLLPSRRLPIFESRAGCVGQDRGMAQSLHQLWATGERFVSSGAMGVTEFPQRFIPNYALHSSVQPLGTVPEPCVRRAATLSRS